MQYLQNIHIKNCKNLNNTTVKPFSFNLMGPCISKRHSKHSKQPPPPIHPYPPDPTGVLPPKHPIHPLDIKSSTNIRISEERDSTNCILNSNNKPISRNSHPTKKKNLTSYNLTDCDVTFTNNNMDISPIYVPKSSYHEKMNFKMKKDSYETSNILPIHMYNKSCLTHKTRDSRGISQENLLFLKKNLEDFFRNRPKEDNLLESAQNYVSSEPQEDTPVLNISVIELESEENKQDINIANNTMIYRNQLILLTQEILKDSQESHEHEENIMDFHIFGALEGNLSTDEEAMLMKYAKLWHHLSNAYQAMGLWSECLNALLPLATLYFRLGLKKHMNVLLVDAYFIQIMLVLYCGNGKKKGGFDENSNEIQRVSMLLCFIEEKLKNENFEEFKPLMSFLRFFQGVLTKNDALCMEVVKDFEDANIVSCEEYAEMIEFIVIIIKY